MNATEFCQLVETRLGWEAPAGGERRRYMTEAGKVNKAIAKNPHVYTWDNLRLAVELLRREKKSRTPFAVLAHVERARDLALDQDTDVEADIRGAMAIETEKGDLEGWAVRFARTEGAYRRIVLDEWKAQHSG